MLVVTNSSGVNLLSYKAASHKANEAEKATTTPQEMLK